MPTAPVRLSWADGLVAVEADGSASLEDADGEVVTVRLTGVRPLGLTCRADDEAEHEYAGAHLRIFQRHAVGETWRWRWVVANETADAAEVDVRLDLACAPGYAAWCWAAGASGLIVVAPTERQGPVLAVRLDQGWWGMPPRDERRPGSPDPEGSGRLRLAPPELTLDPGRRWVVSATGEWLTGIDQVLAKLPAWMQWPYLDADEPWGAELADVGVTADDAVELYFGPETGLVWVTAEPGSHIVGVHEGRGITTVALEWARPLAEVAAAVGSDALDPGGSAPDPAVALCLQYALDQGAISAAGVDDVLDLVDWTGHDGLFGVAFGLQRAVRDGEAVSVTEALRILDRLPATIGFGRVVMRAWLACVATGVDARRRCLDLLGRRATDGFAALESSLLHYRSPDSGMPGLAGLVNLLGGELPGEPYAMSWAEQARLVGVLDLCPEEWPVAALAAEVAGKTRTRILSAWSDGRLADAEPIAWLVLGTVH